MVITKLFETDRSWALFIARLTLGLVMLPHGGQKLFGWFGGPGFSNTLGWLSGHLGLPTPLAVLVILAESVGALLLVVGGLSRLSALGVASVMVGAMAQVHLAHGFFMNWSGAKTGEGVEYHLLALGLSLTVILFGGGRYALDHWIVERLRKPAAVPSPVGA